MYCFSLSLHRAVLYCVFFSIRSWFGGDRMLSVVTECFPLSHKTKKNRKSSTNYESTDNIVGRLLSDGGWLTNKWFEVMTKEKSLRRIRGEKNLFGLKWVQCHLCLMQQMWWYNSQVQVIKVSLTQKSLIYVMACMLSFLVIWLFRLWCEWCSREIPSFDAQTVIGDFLPPFVCVTVSHGGSACDGQLSLSRYRKLWLHFCGRGDTLWPLLLCLSWGALWKQGF